MPAYDIVLSQDKPLGPNTCAKCAHLITSPLSCTANGPLTPCDQFKDASIDRTLRRGVKGVNYPR